MDFPDAIVTELNASIGASEKFSKRSLAAEMEISYKVFLRYLNRERELPLKVLTSALTTLGEDPAVFMQRASDRLQQK